MLEPLQGKKDIKRAKNKKNDIFGKGRAAINSSLYKLKFLTVKFGFLSLFGMRSIKKMSKYFDLIAEKRELI